MFHTSYIEISKSALKNNLQYLKKRIGPETRFSSVIKGNAYGHSIELFVPLAEESGIRHFGSFSADEALRAYQVKSNESGLMIMGFLDNDEIGWAIEHDIEFFVFEMDRLFAAAEASKKIGKPARVHIELETGMYRTGFEEEELEEVANFILDNGEFFKIEGICTHYAGAESVANYLRVINQIKTFRQRSGLLKRKGIEPAYLHTACSAAALNYKDSIMDMVRFGISQYGFWPNQETFMQNILKEGKKNVRDPLQSILTWKSKVMSLKIVDAGNFIGYGTSYMANRRTKIATVPIGYSHGFGRNLSNLGIVLIRGKRASVLGVVNMNMIVVDVTSIPGVQKGDEVVIIGKQKREQITVSSFSELSNRVNYEMLTRLPMYLPRIVVE